MLPTSWPSERLSLTARSFCLILKSGLSVLDCGCGPGSITIGIAARTAPSEVVGIDVAQSQIERARAAAGQEGSRTARFEAGDAYSLAFDSGTFDRAFTHALLEQLANSVAALHELCRILKPGGLIGVCSPDWDGFILSPPSRELSHAVEAYRALQSTNDGDVRVGRKLELHLAAAGFGAVSIAARYECYPSLECIDEYLAVQLGREGDAQTTAVFRNWSQEKADMFAQTWVSAVGVKPQ